MVHFTAAQVQEDTLDFLKPHLANLKTLLFRYGLPNKQDYQVGVFSN